MEADGLPLPRRHASMLIIALGTLMAVLDSSIANVALPTIARQLQVSPAGSIWIVNAYQLVLVISILPVAALGEILGYARVFRWSLALFTLASLCCALSDSLATLTAARALQGLGGAGLMSISGALIRHTYPQAQLGRGLGLNALTVGVSMALGPPICAAILAVASWPWIFAVNVPIGLVMTVAAGRILPHVERSARDFDWRGAVLNAAAFGLLLLGLESLTQRGSPLFAAIEVAVAVTAGVLLARHSLGQAHPLVPLDLLRLGELRLSLLTGVCAFASYSLCAVSLPFVLQYGYGRTAAETGLLMAPWPIAVVAMAAIAGRMADRFPVPIIAGAGLALMTAGLASLALLPPHPSAFDVCWRTAVGGTGFAFFQSPNNRSIIGAAPRARSGAAGALLAVARLLGFSTGATIAALLFRLRPGDHTALAPMLLAAGFAGVAAVVSVVRLGTPAAAAAG